MNPRYLKREKQLLSFLAGKRVLVTGGTGSFGKTFVDLCLAKSRAKEVVVFSRDEQKHVAMQRQYKDSRLKYVIGDVRDRSRLDWAMRDVDYVFNAAAMKYVHFTEEHPMEAVQTNIVGAYNVTQAALEAGVKGLVTLSTDKAVEPVNTMGMSKALQERIVASFAGLGMRVAVTRYGNVLASNGSLVPFFRNLLEQGETVLPVTDRRMTRFVLTLRDSVHLVLHALKHGHNGQTYVLDLPAFGIWDVAEVMADYANRHGRKVRIKEVGMLPGEKLHETLISSEEMRRAENQGDFWVIHRYESAEQRFTPARAERSLISNAVHRMTKHEIFALLKRENLLPRL